MPYSFVRFLTIIAHSIVSRFAMFADAGCYADCCMVKNRIFVNFRDYILLLQTIFVTSCFFCLAACVRPAGLTLLAICVYVCTIRTYSNVQFQAFMFRIISSILFRCWALVSEISRNISIKIISFAWLNRFSKTVSPMAFLYTHPQHIYDDCIHPCRHVHKKTCSHFDPEIRANNNNNNSEIEERREYFSVARFNFQLFRL